MILVLKINKLPKKVHTKIHLMNNSNYKSLLIFKNVICLYTYIYICTHIYTYITDMNIYVNIFLKHGYFLLIETNNPDWSWQLFSGCISFFRTKEPGNP